LDDSSCQKQSPEEILQTKNLFDLSGIEYYKLE
jgi:hypothetical protein